MQPGYLVPRGDGRYVLGATVEERGYRHNRHRPGRVRAAPRRDRAGPGRRRAGDRGAGRPGSDRVRPTTPRSSAPARSPACSGRPVTIATGSCWPRSPRSSISAQLAGEELPELAMPFDPLRFDLAGAPGLMRVLVNGAGAHARARHHGRRPGRLAGCARRRPRRRGRDRHRGRSPLGLEHDRADAGGAGRGADRGAGRVRSRCCDRSTFVIADRRFDSRLILGTGGFTSHELLAGALAAAEAELCTVALRRLDPAAQGSILDVLDRAGVEVLPNTAGCYTARDAIAHRPARPRGVLDRLDQARGDRRRPHAAPRRRRAGRGRRGARRRGLRRAAVHHRRPDPGPPARRTSAAPR